MATSDPNPNTRRNGIVVYVDRYRSALLDDEMWARYGDDLRTFVVACRPSSPTDTRALLGSMARFLTDTGPHEFDLRETVTRVRVNRWLATTHTKAGTNRGTLQNRSGQLKRWLDALHPDTAIARPDTPAVPIPTPYTGTELAALLEMDPLVRQVVASGIAFGVAGDEINGALMSGDQLVTRRGRIVQAPGTDDVSPHLPEVALPVQAWRHASTIAREAGIDLTKRRLRATWASRLISAPITARQMSAFGASRETLRHAAKSLQPDTQAALNAALKEILKTD